MSFTATGWQPPLWLAVLAAVMLVGLAAHHVYRARPTSGGDQGWSVTLEVVVLSVQGNGTLGYRVLTGKLPAGAEPDAAALAVSGLDRQPPIPGAVSHATSWRAETDRGLVLTYTALPDVDAARAVPLADPSIVCSTDPLRPAPGGLHSHHIAAHGARHLAYLARTDPTIRSSAAQAPAIWALISATANAPVAPHDRAHILAEGSLSDARPTS